MPDSIHIGFVLFPRLTQLDLTGPLQVLTRVPGATVHLLWKRIEPVPSDTALLLTPTMSFDACPQLDVLCVPGGIGTDDMVNDEEVLSFLRRQADGAKFVTSVCTGSLVLAAAGLLDGYRATTHWAAMDHLGTLGATPVETRVCADRNRITGGGVTAGIDFGLTVAAELAGRHVAELIQLTLEYDPAPPFNAGSPKTAPAKVVADARTRMAPWAERRQRAVERAAARRARIAVPAV